MYENGGGHEEAGYEENDEASADFALDRVGQVVL